MPYLGPPGQSSSPVCVAIASMLLRLPSAGSSSTAVPLLSRTQLWAPPVVRASHCEASRDNYLRGRPKLVPSLTAPPPRDCEPTSFAQQLAESRSRGIARCTTLPGPPALNDV